jgi:hypothetical protein
MDWIKKEWDKLLIFSETIASGINDAFLAMGESISQLFKEIWGEISKLFEDSIKLMNSAVKLLVPKSIQEKIWPAVEQNKQSIYQVNNPRQEISTVTNIHLTGVPAGMSANSMDANTYILGAQ